jgi:hypothetical protein
MLSHWHGRSIRFGEGDCEDVLVPVIADGESILSHDWEANDGLESCSGIHANRPENGLLAVSD